MINKLYSFAIVLNFMFFVTHVASAQHEFITTWKTNNPGTSSSTEITIPTMGSGYNYDVDWNNDGIFDEIGLTGNVTHDFGTEGEYTIRIQGDFPRIFFDGGGDRLKILSVDQWGSISWSSFHRAFNDCSNLIVNATDTPDLSGVTSLSFAFAGCSSMTGDLSLWDVSNVIDMSFTFIGAGSFNCNLSSWVTSSVTTMQSMFRGASSFDRNIGMWDISQVTNMDKMFYSHNGMSTSNYDKTLIGWKNQLVQPNVVFDGGDSEYCHSESARNALMKDMGWTITDNGFNSEGQEFITTWTVNSSGTKITIPTYGTGYNYDVDWDNDGKYDETNITGDAIHNFMNEGTYTVRIKGEFPRIYFNNSGEKDKITDVVQWGTIDWYDMENAFYGCSNLNISATDAPDLSRVTDIDNIFRGCLLSTCNIGNWHVSSITSMKAVFMDSFEFDADISSWDVGNVTGMWAMFLGTKFNHDISNWDVGEVRDFSLMFQDVHEFNQDISNWDVSRAQNMYRMFYDATSFNQDIGSWDVSEVTNMGGMLRGASSFDQNIGNWNIGNVTNMTSMFRSAKLSTQNYDSLLTGWHNKSPQFNVVFDGGNSTYCESSLDRDALDGPYAWTITDGGMDCSYQHFVTTWKTDNRGISGETEITIPTTGSGYNYDIDWNNDGVFDEFGITGSVTHDFGEAGTYTIRIKGDFPRIYFGNGGDKEKILDIEQWGTIEWASMEAAFDGCWYMVMTATDVPNLSNVTSFRNIFRECRVFSGDLSNWDVSNVTNMYGAFLDAYAFNEDISSWDVSNVTDMWNMFGKSDFNQDISNWNVGQVRNFSKMFERLEDFNCDISGWNTSRATNMSEMFNQATSFDQNLGNWDITNVTNMTDMFNGVKLSDANYDALLIGWYNLGTINFDISFNAGSSQYCEGSTAREVLINTYGWTITDGGWESNPPVPDAETLPDFVAECEIIAVKPPFATDDCASSVTITNDGTFPITSPGTTVITWTYDDGHGNTSTQTQNLIINDQIAPVPGISNPISIRTLCSLTPNAPTATDNCDEGKIYGTTDTEFPVTAIGTTEVVWTFTDSNGNTSQFLQNIIIDGLDPDIYLKNDQQTLTTDESKVTYQWVDCNNANQPIDGETNSSFTPTVSGNYAVEVTWSEGCSYMSDCMYVDIPEVPTGLSNDIFDNVSISPNPTNGLVNITLEGLRDVTIKVRNIGGQIVYFEDNINASTHSFTLNTTPGLYFIEIMAEGKKELFKLIKE